jgi:hypothetical protein
MFQRAQRILRLGRSTRSEHSLKTNVVSLTVRPALRTTAALVIAGALTACGGGGGGGGGVTAGSTAVGSGLVASPDNATTTENTPVTIDVLANDNGVASSAVTIEIIGSPANGSATVQPDNTIAYTPKDAYAGSDTFTYKVIDANGVAAVSSVQVQVNCANCAADVSLTLTWQPNPDAVLGYSIYYGPTGDTADRQASDVSVDSRLFDASAPALTFNATDDLGLRLGDSVCFRIQAYNSNGKSPLSDPVCTVI